MKVPWYIWPHGVALLTCSFPFMMWLVAAAGIATGASDGSIKVITRECIQAEGAVLSMTLCVYLAIWILQWRDRRKESKEKA